MLRLKISCMVAALALTACDVELVWVDPLMESPVVVEEAAPTSARKADLSIRPVPPIVSPEPIPPVRKPPTTRRARAGVVTAGDIDDMLNLAAFQRYQQRSAQQTGLPRINFAAPVRLRVHARGKGRAGVQVSLRKQGAAEPFFTGMTGVDGRLTVFPAQFGAGRPGVVEARVFSSSGIVRTHQVTTGGPIVNIMMHGQADYKPEFLDLVFVFDTTGSMGDELAWLTKEFRSLIGEVRKAAPQADLRFGLVAYRDQGDAYVVRNFGFTQRQGEMQRWLKSLNAGGGGDYPEAADAALMAAADLPWRRGYGERLMFHIADAPPHKAGAKRFLNAVRKAGGKNVQIFGLGASGVADEAEFLMRQAALATQGRYVFLTDDSGVGNAHAEPKVACYRVTRLKSLLSRVLRSEMTGKRIEARGSDVIRSVGTYRNGVCLQ